MNKIALGTAQFGMSYGINNKRGEIPEDEVFKIIDKAISSGVDLLDTAYSYGNAERLIGKYCEKYRKNFRIISKIHDFDNEEIEDIFMASLENLNTGSIYGYLIHSYKTYAENNMIWIKLEKLKSQGKIQKIGFSLYYEDALELILKNKMKIDIVQVPYSIFDQRFAPYFPELKKKGVEIIVRSVFLQGLVFTNPDYLDEQFVKLKDKIKDINLLSCRLGVPVVALYLNFAILNRYVDRVLIGVDGLDDFEESISLSKYFADVEKIYSKLLTFKEDDKNVILPIKWKGKTNKIIAIIQARVSSTRLPGKVLLDLEGKTVLERVLERVGASKLIEDIIVATTLDKDDLEIIRICSNNNIRVYSGSKKDVLDRYYQAARNLDAKHIVRITADCPLIDPKVVDDVIALHLKTESDYTSNTIKETYPEGQDVEVFTFEALSKAWKNAWLNSEREHVTAYMYKNHDIFRITNLEYKGNIGNKRMTLDYPSDYKVIKLIYKNLYYKNPIFSLEEICEFLNNNTEITKINQCFIRNKGYERSLRTERHKL